MCEHLTSPSHDLEQLFISFDKILFYGGLKISLLTNFLAISGYFEQLFFPSFLTKKICTPPNLFIFWGGG